MTLAFVLNVLRRRWPTILLSVIVLALVAAGYANSMPTRYSATASLVVTPVISNPMTGSREEVNIRTEQEILGSRAVAERAAELLDIPLSSGSFLRADVETAAPSGSQILQVTVGASTPEEAAAGANAIVEAYLALRLEAAESVTEQYLAGADEQIAALQGEPSTPAVQSLIENLQQQRSSVALASTEPGRIIGLASLPSEPSGPGLLITTAGGAMAGLLLGIATAVLRERLDPKVRTADRLEMAVGPLPVVAGRHPDDDFWRRLADEAIQRSQVATENAPVRVLLHADDPAPSEVVLGQFRDAAERVLQDVRTQTSWLDGWGAGKRAASPDPSAAGTVQIVQAGAYRSSLAHSARRSDIGVLVVSPHTALRTVGEQIAALRDCGLQVVIGLCEEPRPLSEHAEHDEHQEPTAREQGQQAPTPPPQPQQDVEPRELPAAPVGA